jgi:hypothetical protein
MSLHFFSKRIALRSLAVACALGSLVPLHSQAGVGRITDADLYGTWTATIAGFTGCGQVAMLATINMNAAGTGTVTLTTHGSCGDSVLAGQTFAVHTLDATTGAGTAGLSCGAGCGWNLRIQVSPDRQVMNLIDVDSVNPGNYIAGVAIHQ